MRRRGQERETWPELMWCSYVGLEVSTLVKKSRSDTKMVVSTVTTKVSFRLVTEFGVLVN